jgi:hypothetical protein
MLNVKGLAVALAVGLGGLAVADDRKPAAPPPEPRKVLAGVALVEEIATTTRMIYPDLRDLPPQKLYLLVDSLLELHTGRRPTPEEVTAMVADVANFKPRPKPEMVLKPAEEALPTTPALLPADDLMRPVLRLDGSEMKRLLDDLKGGREPVRDRKWTQPFNPFEFGNAKPTGGARSADGHGTGGFQSGYGGATDRRRDSSVVGGFAPAGGLTGGFGRPPGGIPARPPGR